MIETYGNKNFFNTLCNHWLLQNDERKWVQSRQFRIKRSSFNHSLILGYDVWSIKQTKSSIIIEWIIIHNLKPRNVEKCCCCWNMGDNASIKKWWFAQHNHWFNFGSRFRLDLSLKSFHVERPGILLLKKRIWIWSNCN